MYHPTGAIGACPTVGRMSLVRVGQRRWCCGMPTSSRAWPDARRGVGQIRKGAAQDRLDRLLIEGDAQLQPRYERGMRADIVRGIRHAVHPYQGNGVTVEAVRPGGRLAPAFSAAVQAQL